MTFALAGPDADERGCALMAEVRAAIDAVLARHGVERRLVTRRRVAPADPKLAVAYLRCSTDRQDLSPDAQRAAIDRWAAGVGVTVVAWHEDLGVSGGTALEDRPGLLAALDSLATHAAGVLVVAKRDRLARDVLTAALVERLCERKGARIQTADGTGNGDGPEAALMRHAAGRLRRLRAGAHQGADARGAGGQEGQGRAHRGRADGQAGRGAGGSSWTGARRRRWQGPASSGARGESLREIAMILAAEGHRPRGARWHIQTISRVVAGA